MMGRSATCAGAANVSHVRGRRRGMLQARATAHLQRTGKVLRRKFEKKSHREQAPFGLTGNSKFEFEFDRI